MRFALVQLNPTIGDVAGNVRRVLDALGRERARGTDVAVFPELTLIGYPPRDLLLRPPLIEANLKALQEVAAACEGIAAVVGFAEPNPLEGRPLYNAAAFLADRRVLQTFRKSLLPTYDVFDEDRYFEPSHETRIVQACGRKIGVSICEDIWNPSTRPSASLGTSSTVHPERAERIEGFWTRRAYAFDPVQAQVDLGAEVLVNISASPYHAGKERLRQDLLSTVARRHGRPVLYVNQVGGNDELVFDGRSLAIGPDGAVLARAASFEEDAVQVDLSAMRGEVREGPADDLESVYRALVLGTRDYLRKCGFQGAVIGLSGGIDSALTACIAVDALGRENVQGVAMPSRYSSEHSKTDAEALARNLGIRYLTVPIEEPFAAFLNTLAESFRGREPDVTEENLQARIRGAILMALSNKFSMLVLSTGNKSELAVGYCTLYGDMCGGLDVLADVPKTMVYALSRWVNREREVIPASTIAKPPSAELRPNQTDQDSLPPYDVLDGILKLYVEDEVAPSDIVSRGFDAATVARVVRMVDGAEFKRRQAAPGLRVTTRAFGIGRRIPIAQRFRSSTDESPSA